MKKRTKKVALQNIKGGIELISLTYQDTFFTREYTPSFPIIAIHTYKKNGKTRFVAERVSFIEVDRDSLTSQLGIKLK